MSNRIQTRECASYYHCARSCRQQTNPSRKKHFPSGWKCYKTIGSYVSCAFIEIWSTREVWRGLKKLELLSARPRATLTHLSCSPNFPRASYLDERTLMYEPIVNWKCFKTIGSCVSCVFIEIWSTWEVWRALKKLELEATPRATLTHLSCSPNFPRASYLDERTLTYEPIVKWPALRMLWNTL